MSSGNQERVMGAAPARFSFQRVALVGGGRWSRVLLPVMRSLLSPECQICWVTQNGFEQAMNWLAAKQLSGIEVESHLDFGAGGLNAAVVATSPQTHAGHVRTLLSHHVPVLCEKPLTQDLASAIELKELAEKSQAILGVNLEMPFASYYREFAQLVAGSAISELSIRWLDPWTETRYGETKHGDVYTSLVDDMWPHCWSLLRGLLSVSEPRWRITDVDYDLSDGHVRIVGCVEETPFTVEFSRRNASRVRRIEVNGALFTLDFGVEPGLTVVDGVATENRWQGERPLARTLTTFFEVVESPTRAADWELSVSRVIDSVSIAGEIKLRLEDLQKNRLDQFRTVGIDLQNPLHRNLIIDLYLPKYAESDRRWPAITIEDQIQFVARVCEDQGLPIQLR